MATMNVSLPGPLAKEVERLVSSGAYASSSELVREALRHLLERESKLAWLKAEVQKGIEEADLGELSPLNVDDIIQDGKETLAREKRESA